MLHTKLHENRPAGSGEGDFSVVFTIYGRGAHLGHVTWISRSNFHLPYPWMLHIKFHFDWPSRFLKWFYHIWAWLPSWSCDQDIANKITMALPKEAPHKISTRSAKRFQRRRSLKL